MTTTTSANEEASKGTPGSPDQTTPSPSQPSFKRVLWENFVSIGVALFLVFAVRSTVVEAFKIPSGSMIPTLLIGDHIFVNKMAYGIKLPFSDWVLDAPIYLYKKDPPKQGDIIVFVYPNDRSLYYIKRVVGTPGDVITVRGKEVEVNGKAIARTPLSSEDRQGLTRYLDEGDYQEPELFWETLQQGKHLMMQDQMLGALYDEGEQTWQVPAGHFFVMGDNRDHSNDSRAWGFVPFENVRGKAFVVWLSFQFDWAQGIRIFRPERIWNSLQ
jgi:signal peptidase I